MLYLIWDTESVEESHDFVVENLFNAMDSDGPKSGKGKDSSSSSSSSSSDSSKSAEACRTCDFVFHWTRDLFLCVLSRLAANSSWTWLCKCEHQKLFSQFHLHETLNRMWRFGQAWEHLVWRTRKRRRKENLASPSGKATTKRRKRKLRHRRRSDWRKRKRNGSRKRRRRKSKRRERS